MDAAQRRREILEQLTQSGQPVSAGSLAERFHVSRQVIVGDVALLRAASAPISATPRGYVLPREPASGGILHTIACRHGCDGLARELYTVVDCGCGLIDVIVEHPIYGQLSGRLDIFSRGDADAFLEKLQKERFSPLSDLTDGIHLHTVSSRSRNDYERMLLALKEEGILFSR